MSPLQGSAILSTYPCIKRLYFDDHVHSLMHWHFVQFTVHACYLQTYVLSVSTHSLFMSFFCSLVDFIAAFHYVDDLRARRAWTLRFRSMHVIMRAACGKSSSTRYQSLRVVFVVHCWIKSSETSSQMWQYSVVWQVELFVNRCRNHGPVHPVLSFNLSGADIEKPGIRRIRPSTRFAQVSKHSHERCWRWNHIAAYQTTFNGITQLPWMKHFRLQPFRNYTNVKHHQDSELTTQHKWTANCSECGKLALLHRSSQLNRQSKCLTSSKCHLNFRETVHVDVGIAEVSRNMILSEFLWLCCQIDFVLELLLFIACFDS